MIIPFTGQVTPQPSSSLLIETSPSDDLITRMEKILTKSKILQLADASPIPQWPEDRKSHQRSRLQFFLSCFTTSAILEQKTRGKAELEKLTNEPKFKIFKSSIISLIGDINQCILVKKKVEQFEAKLKKLIKQWTDKDKTIEHLVPLAESHAAKLKDLHDQKKKANTKSLVLELEIAKLHEGLTKSKFQSFTLQEAITQEETTLKEYTQRLQEVHEAKKHIHFQHSRKSAAHSKTQWNYFLV